MPKRYIHIARRHILLVLVIGVQALCLGSVLCIMLSWMQNESSRVLKQEFMALHESGSTTGAPIQRQVQAIQNTHTETLLPIKKYGLALIILITSLARSWVNSFL